jgi:hypothetical protein
LGLVELLTTCLYSKPSINNIVLVKLGELLES